MAGEVCQVCGRCGERDAMVQHCIVPAEVAAETGIDGPEAICLCTECHRLVRSWYHNRVSRTTYDSGTKRFRPRSAHELAREYRAAFGSFLDYVAQQRRTPQD